MLIVLLELARLDAVLLRQDDNFADVYVKKHTELERMLRELPPPVLDE